MKRCPKCSTDYFDNMLDFCLDDGTRLLLLKQKNDDSDEIPSTQATTVALNSNFNPDAFSQPEKNSQLQNEWLNGLQNQSEGIKQKVTSQGMKTLEISPVVLALAHNYWQWLYLARKSYYDFSSFFFSLDFIIWFILLIAGVVLGVTSLKYSKRKDFAITALVVLAINVILSIVPK